VVLPPHGKAELCGRDSCAGANSAGFRFCQWCGWARPVRDIPRVSVGTINDEAIAERRTALFAEIEGGKAHVRSKHKEFDLFDAFVQARPTPSLRRESALQACPEDVVDFLVYRDLQGTGRQTVHLKGCVVRGKGANCDCPKKRMGSSAVQQVASKIRTRFSELGCAAPWSYITFSGNPGNSALVHRYTSAVKEEQGKAGCVPVTARQRAMLPGRMQQFVSRMRDQAAFLLATDTIQYVELLRDLAWFMVQFRSYNRGGELAGMAVELTALGPNKSCLLLQCAITKTNRGGATNEYCVAALPGDEECPVKAFCDYVEESTELLGWNWEEETGRPIFPQIQRDGSRSEKGVTAAAMSARYLRYLKAMFPEEPQVAEGLTLHGLRSGAALRDALEGTDLKDVMMKGFWKRPETALHYVGLLQEIGGEEFLAALRERGRLTKQDFATSRASGPPRWVKEIIKGR
jgi:hypothetical protein